MSFHVPNKFRVRSGYMGNDDSVGNCGLFEFVAKLGGVRFRAIASDGMGWEHVSVSRPDRIPSWDEMCWIKSLFWDDGDCVVQYHPPRAEWVNNHSRCLHMWRPVGVELPRPPQILVGVQSLGVLA